MPGDRPAPRRPTGPSEGSDCVPELTPQLLLVGKLFFLMGLGVLLRKRGVVPEEGKQVLTDLIIQLILPCSILGSFLTELTAERLLQTLEIFLLSLGIQLFSYLWGLLAYRRCEPGHKTVMQYATVCSNSGILGTPIAEGIFGAEGTLLSAVFLIPLRVVMWTLGLSFFTRKSGAVSWKKIVTHPCIAAVLIGLVLFVTGLRPPALVTDTLEALGGCNTALSMLLVGAIVADMPPGLLLHRDTVYYSAVRLVILPLLVLAVCRLLAVDPLVRNISVVLTAMPAGATTSILALKYQGDAPFASACTAVTTVLSLIAVPLWCAALGVG